MLRARGPLLAFARLHSAKLVVFGVLVALIALLSYSDVARWGPSFKPAADSYVDSLRSLGVLSARRALELAAVNALRLREQRLSRRPSRITLPDASLDDVPSGQPRPGTRWSDTHEKYVKEVADMNSRRGEFPEVIFYGDSITELWRATSVSHVEKSYEAVPAIFERLFGRWHSTTLAISGDQTSHLLWRLRNGEIPSAASPKAVVVHIGTNDLTMHASQSARAQTGTALQRRAAVAEKAPLVVQGVRHVATVLKRRMPSAAVLLSMILPRGTHYNKTGGDLAQPGLYSDAIKAVNLGLVDLASSMGLHTVDCGPLFLTADGNLNQTLMTDGLHPSPMGYEKWGQCHFKALEDLLA
ncbi:hypothetical protein H632_c1683p0 [Helicosporidium sp. ATCC 50920]|nr:hypothetical protein H632_c1683p0 [Helicosporidium sp. ATCC 50920]|eukprot:KDD73976.1 hypothetical protein H632_c1683p0 [Helicosporidium sp. ATCC 50920]